MADDELKRKLDELERDARRLHHVKTLDLLEELQAEKPTATSKKVAIVPQPKKDPPTQVGLCGVLKEPSAGSRTDGNVPPPRQTPAEPSGWFTSMFF